MSPNTLTKKLTELQSKYSKEQKTLQTMITTPPPSQVDISSQNSTTTSNTKTSFNSFASPKMTKLLNSKNSNVIYSYHGPLDFADDQASFNSIFGANPQMTIPTVHRKHNASQLMESQSPEFQKKLQKFIDACIFDIFVDLCKMDYVGSDYIKDDIKAVQAIEKRIKSLKMQFLSHKSNTFITVHPNDLYTKYLNLIPCLPKNPAKWNIILCTTFYNALTEDLKEKMTEIGFRMPGLTSLNSKSSHLSALRSVKETAADCHRHIQNEEHRLKQLIAKSTNNTHPQTNGRVHFYDHNQHQYQQPVMDNPHNQTQQQQSVPVYFHQQSSASRAEETIQRYHPQPPNPNDSKKAPLPTVRKSDGLEYPYRLDEPSVISDFPIGFRGCYACGGQHSYQQCPVKGQSGVGHKFWRNLWIHKPHLKNRPNSQRSQPNTTAENNHYGPPGPPQHTYHPSATINYHQPTEQQLPPAPSGTPFNPPGVTGIGRGIAATTPSWLTHPQQRNTNNEPPTEQNEQKANRDKSYQKRNRLFVQWVNIFKQSSSTLRQMPIDLDNGLPGIAIRFESNTNTKDDDEIVFGCLVDTCAAMNTGNLLVHKWIMSQHPHLVVEYSQHDDTIPFEPLQLRCALEQDGSTIATENSNLNDCLTAVVRYRTKYTFTNGQPVTIAFGLGAHVAVNSIIGLPTLRQWKADIQLSSSCLLAKELNIEFPLEFAQAVHGIPHAANFNVSDFVRPVNNHANDTTNLPLTPSTIDNICAKYDTNTLDEKELGISETDTDNQYVYTVTEDSSKGYLQRSVSFKLQEDEITTE